MNKYSVKLMSRALRDLGGIYEVKPVARFFKELDCQVPVGHGVVCITLKDGRLETFYREK